LRLAFGGREAVASAFHESTAGSEGLMPQSSTMRVLRRGLLVAWPICLGYVPIGMALGVLAQKVGLPPLAVGFMSLVVFAGSSQFIAVSMLGSGMPALTIVLTTFVVNLRHLLMSSALAVSLRGRPHSVLTLFAYGVTDESFAVNYPKLMGGDWYIEHALVVNHAANITWIVSSIAGAYGGQYIPEGAFGIDYALIAMFIGLLVFQLRGWIYVITAFTAGALAVGLSLAIPGNWHIILGSVMAASLGAYLKYRCRRSST
jgi:4-azaleucine resistance transporter AzlC